MPLPENGMRWLAIQPEAVEVERNAFEVDMVVLLAHLLRKAKRIILFGLLGALLAGAYTCWLVTPLYEATAKLYVLSGSNAEVDLSALQTGTQLAADYKEVFSNWHVHQRVIEQLNLPYSYRELSRMVRVSNQESARILHISVRSASAQEAKQMADAYAQVARTFIAQTMATARPNMFEEALLPTAPASPNKARSVLLGFLTGAFVAAAVIVVRFLADDHIRSQEDIIRYVDLPVLGVMPKVRGQGKRRATLQKVTAQ